MFKRQQSCPFCLYRSNSVFKVAIKKGGVNAGSTLSRTDSRVETLQVLKECNKAGCVFSRNIGMLRSVKVETATFKSIENLRYQIKLHALGRSMLCAHPRATATCAVLTCHNVHYIFMYT